MTLSHRARSWSLILIIILASGLGGVFGNWLFIYWMDAYYGLPAGNYGSEQAPIENFRPPSAKDFAAANEAVGIAAAAEASLVGLFHRQPAAAVYLPKDKLAHAAALTADGWLLVPSLIPASAATGSKDLVAIASDRKMYDIDRLVADAPAQVTFVHLAKANNLPVRDFRAASDLSWGQNIFGLEWQGAIERGLISRTAAEVRSSDVPFPDLAVSGLSGRNEFLFDAQGRLAGYARGNSAFAMDTVKALLDKVLSTGTVSRAAFGVNALNLSATANNPQVGIILAARGKEPAVLPNSPAARAGLQAGDIITRFDEQDVSKASDLVQLVAGHKPGDSVAIEYLRRGEARQAVAVLDALVQK